MRVQHILLLVTTAFIVPSAQDVIYKDCGSRVPIISVSVDQCGREQCILLRGGVYTFRIHFRAVGWVGSFGDVELNGIIWGRPVPFPLGMPQICGNVQPRCPIKEGEEYRYSKSIHIEYSRTPMDFPLQWKLKNGAGRTMVCVEIPVRIL
ncbi:hypothetical protein CRM22_006752 [Opisthorchis felineus]|uniref:MD-2-related lipid-recognition domain-containing protein n=1 Tax=Opisthorchis felineus TaxID=147828 RepID=A0A4S2LJL3_OPIFE|nr:hypothetical protein CRM22_006752 [Opisthorchis felineus]